jgi:hypothetical protein
MQDISPRIGASLPCHLNATCMGSKICNLVFVAATRAIISEPFVISLKELAEHVLMLYNF